MIITTADAPAAIGPYVQGVNLGAMTITSGQLPINPQDGTMPDDIAEQARQSLENVKAIVEAAGLSVGQIVKTTVFVKDRRILPPSMPPTRPSLPNIRRPFRRAPAWKWRLPKDAGVEIEAIAFAR